MAVPIIHRAGARSAPATLSLSRFMARASSTRAGAGTGTGPRILINGSGIAGPTLASFLLLAPVPAAQKARITLLERAPQIGGQGQNIDVRGAGRDIIRKLGVEDAVRAATTGEEGVEIVDQDGRVRARLEADKSGEVETGTSDMEVLRGHLAEILAQQCRRISDTADEAGAPPIEFLYGDHFDDLTQSECGQKVHVRLAQSGEEREYDLVVGADGLQSRTRRMVFGEAAEKDRINRLDMYGAFFSTSPSETDSLWRRWFHATGGRSIMLRPDRVGGRTTVFMSVVEEDDGRFRHVAQLHDPQAIEAQKNLMAEYFRDAGWESNRVCRAMQASTDFYYDEIAQVKQEPLSKGRVVLLGDAGYCASPVSGMGTTLAMVGAYDLAGCLLRHPSDHAAAFARYEEKMRPLIEKGQKLAPGAPNTFNPQTQAGVGVFNNFLSFMDKSGLAKTMFKVAGPPAKEATVEDYGFQDAPSSL